MILSTLETLPGYEIAQTFGIARGSTVRARNVGRDIMASFRGLVGGEIVEYSKLQGHAREQALQRMAEQARLLGANAVLGVRMTTSMIAQGTSEIAAYGTAVKIGPARNTGAVSGPGTGS